VADTEQAISRLRVAYSYCEQFAKFKRPDYIFDPAEFNDASDALSLAAKNVDDALEADPFATLPVEDKYGRRDMSIDEITAEVSLLQGILFTHPKNVDEFVAMGLESLRKSISHRPFPLAYLKLAETLIRGSRRDEAITALRNGLDHFAADLDLRQLQDRLDRDPTLGAATPPAAQFPWGSVSIVAGVGMMVFGLFVGLTQVAPAALILGSGLCLVLFGVWRWKSGGLGARA
jgi:hypothetical protein